MLAKYANSLDKCFRRYVISLARHGNHTPKQKRRYILNITESKPEKTVPIRTH